MAAEIERRFVLPAVPPPQRLGPGEALRQGYLAAEDDVSVRVRIGERAAVLTVKAGGGLVRTEVEVAIDRDEAEALWERTAGRRLEKVRHRVPVGEGLVADVDVYAGPLAGLCTAEVEFGSEAAAGAFTPPGWFGREVTGEGRWTNAALARHGVPA